VLEPSASVEIFAGIAAWPPRGSSPPVRGKDPPSIRAVIAIVVHIALAVFLLGRNRVICGDSSHVPTSISEPNKCTPLPQRAYPLTPKSTIRLARQWSALTGSTVSLRNDPRSFLGFGPPFRLKRRKPPYLATSVMRSKVPFLRLSILDHSKGLCLSNFHDDDYGLQG